MANLLLCSWFGERAQNPTPSASLLCKIRMNRFPVASPSRLADPSAVLPSSFRRAIPTGTATVTQTPPNTASGCLYQSSPRHEKLIGVGDGEAKDSDQEDR